MGVVLSTDSTLAPISFAGSVIGFVSFAFTLATFFRVVWVNLETFMQSEHGVHTLLNNLREELVEERASLRVLKKMSKQRRRSKKRFPEPLNELYDLELDDVTIKTMSDTIRYLMREFEQVERPFLKKGEEGIQQARRKGLRRRGDMSPSPYHEHSAYASPSYEKRGRRDTRAHDDSDDDVFWAQRCQYAPYTVQKRFDWLSTKSKAQSLSSSIARVQARRIARQVSSIAIMLRGYGDQSMQATTALERLEDRFNRVVGGRRPET